MMPINITEPSVKSLFLQMQFQGQPLSTGTGFIAQSARGPVLITNRHNVTGRHQATNQPLSDTAGIPNEVAILHNSETGLGNWTSRIEPLLRNDTPLWIEHPLLGARADFVALPLTQTDGVKLYPYDLADAGARITIGPAEVVSVVGFPFGLQAAGLAGGFLAIWATGFMASEPEIDYDNLPMFLIDCMSRPGQSGSAVIAHRNGGMVSLTDGSTAAFPGPITRLLGIYSGRINDQSDLGMVWKAQAILQLIDSFA